MPIETGEDVSMFDTTLNGTFLRLEKCISTVTISQAVLSMIFLNTFVKMQQYEPIQVCVQVFQIQVLL